MDDWRRPAHALIAGIIVTIGFIMVWNPIPVEWAVGAGLGFIALLFWMGTTPRHTWAWACLFLGIESLSWPVFQAIRLRMSGVAEPNEDQMREILSASFLGIFFATFWLSFAYGMFRWIKRTERLGESPPQT